MEIYQLIAPLIAIYYIIMIIVELRQRRKFVITTGIWLFFWLIITALAVAPDAVSGRIAEFVGFRSNVSAALFMVSGFLVVISFYLSSRVIALERQVTQLVRNLAIKEKLEEETKEDLIGSVGLESGSSNTGDNTRFPRNSLALHSFHSRAQPQLKEKKDAQEDQDHHAD